MRKLIVFFGSIVLFSLLFFSSLNFVVFERAFYESEFQKNGVYERFGREKAISEREALLDYFTNDEKTIASDFYNKKEKQHLFDVKNLIIYSRIAFYFLFFSVFIFFFIVLFRYRKEFLEIVSEIFLFSGVIVFSLSFVLFLMQSHFSKIFYDFHLLFFSNNYWLLNPATDNLINLFPEAFFFDSAARTFFVLLILGVLFFVEGILMKLLGKKII
jgi:integral membrane protein (TIGR01906 family)